ncbi:MAG: yagF [Verrucomicrobiales bacterium]|nr:yagF [Verrucomicrobiales bacterium]
MSGIFETTETCYDLRTKAAGPVGALPLTEEMLKEWPSGHLFGFSQNAGMGWRAEELGRKQWLILSTQGGVRDEAGAPVALGYHTGHWEIALQVKAAAEELRALKGLPFAGFVSDPCDGRTQGTTGMFDSLPYRNDAAVVFRRLIRSLPQRSGVLGVATCDKGLPAMMMALAAMRDLPVVLVPGGVTLPPVTGEDAGAVQTLGARYSHGMVSLKEAAEAGCRACASPGGGCQFLGTAATSQVVGEALGLSVAHSALAPSGEAVWLEVARRSARALVEMEARGTRGRDILTDGAVRNAMTVHAAFGGSTNLLLHVPAIAHAAGLRRPGVEDWAAVNRATPRLVSVLPNGPVHHPTVQVFLAGGVPEVMLHLRELGLLDLSARTVEGVRVEEMLAAWEKSDRRRRFRDLLFERDGVDPDAVILSPSAAAAAGMGSTVTFLTGNICPEGAVIKSGAIDPRVVDADGVYRFEGPVRFFTSEKSAMAAIKDGSVKAGQVLVLAGCGPMGTGMEETYQLTSALKFLPFGREVALITDARFSGVSTGACIGHAGPEALAGGPLGKLREGDRVKIAIDLNLLSGTADFVGTAERECAPGEGAAILSGRESHPGLAPHPELPDDTKIWAALQRVGGGTWGGCVYDAEAILKALGRA